MTVEIAVASSAPLAPTGIAVTGVPRVGAVLTAYIGLAARSEPASGVALVIRVLP